VDRGLLRDAEALADTCEIIDLHIDTLIPIRIFGWDVRRRHGLGPTRGRFFGHMDLPRIKDGRLGGAMWSITTNPFRTAKGRWRVFQKNLERLRSVVAASEGALAVARDVAEYRRARERGAHAVIPAVQGGSCFDAAPSDFAETLDRTITRVTIVHLTSSVLGATSAPWSKLKRHRGLTDRGRALIERLNHARVFVDLAHVHPDGFWDAVAVHDRTQPLVATHTGVCGVTPHWRNLDDRQIRAIAETGGTIGIIYSKNFLASKDGAKDGGMVLDHMEHITRVAGEDFVSIGSDFDGAIIPPPGLDGAGSYTRLIGHMLERRWSEARIRKAVGQNFLRAFSALRG
jgi:membrane dipeptidase